MIPKKIIVFLLVIILSSMVVFAALEEEEKTAQTTIPPDELEHDYSITGLSGIAVDNGDGTATITGSFTGRDHNSYSGTNIHIDKSGKIQSAGTLVTKDLMGSGIVQYTDNSNGFAVSSAESLQVGNTMISNGEGIVYNSGTLTVEQADGAVLATNYLTNIEQLIATGSSVFSVSSADSVKLDCAMAKDVRDSSFVLDDKITIGSAAGTNYPIVDCAGLQLDYRSLLTPNEFVMTKNSINPSYSLKGVALKITSALYNWTEFINALNSAFITLNREFGVECIDIVPEGSYSYSEYEPTTDFSLSTRGVQHKICFRKKASQQNPLPAGCGQCSYIDLVEKKIESKGAIDYSRNLFDSSFAMLEAGQQKFVFRNNGSASLKYDGVLLYINNLLVNSDSPMYETFASNFLAIVEKQTSTGTHRLIGISEKQNPLSISIIKNYATSYSTATLAIEDNSLEYNRGDLRIRVLPKNSGEINQLVVRQG